MRVAESGWRGPDVHPVAAAHYAPPTQQTPQPTWTPWIIATEIPVPKSALLDLNRIRYEQQGWNNCGPTTMTMALSFYGWPNNQETAARWMKPHTEDKNVSPWQMVRFRQRQHAYTGSRACTASAARRRPQTPARRRVPGRDRGEHPAEGEGWMGHYVLLVGYDDYAQHFLTFDSYLGSKQPAGASQPYSVLTRNGGTSTRLYGDLSPGPRDGTAQHSGGLPSIRSMGTSWHWLRRATTPPATTTTSGLV